MDTVLRDLISAQCGMLVIESSRTDSGMQAFHHPTNNPANAANAANAASCFYKHKLMNELKASHKPSDFANNASDGWQNKYYGPSPPPLTTQSNHFPANVNQHKQYIALPSRDQQNGAVGPYPHDPQQNYHQQPKVAYYPHSTISTTTTSQTASNVFQWQQSLQQQQQQQHLQHRLSHPPPMVHPVNQENILANPSNNRLTDMFLRSQNPAGYLLSLNEPAHSWCQPPSVAKDGLFQPTMSKNICALCGKNYARPSTLKTHMRIHSGERPFHCKVCNKSFSQAANLTAHLRVHSGEKPFSCPVCHKTFSQSSSVTTHMRTHSGDRPYKCPVCRKGFSDSSTLTKHLRIHSGEKPYRCNFCSMSFSQSGNLNRHMKVHEHHQRPESATSNSPRASPH